ncbi:MAG: sigma-70 family RNA polymerase sigma factor [Chloroflexi bacterium]|nr:sigma-70 family RNA polymerase sigma factor [Chloroflexota bacterium]
MNAWSMDFIPSERFSKQSTPHPGQSRQAVPDEQSIIRQARAGDVNAFNQLVVTYQSVAYTTAYRILQNEDAADVVQETFIKAFRALPTFNDGQFRAWLLRILVNTCYDRLRQRRRRVTVSFDELLAPESTAYLADDAEQPEAYAERMDVRQSIERGLAQLSPEQRAAIVLCDIQGYTYEEIALITGASLGTIKSRISRGRLRLRDLLLAQGVLPA